MESSKQIKQQIKQESNSLSFYCKNCRNIGKVMVEVWSEHSQGPVKLLLIQHDDFIAKVVDEIELNDSKCAEGHHYPFCGDCGMLVTGPFETEPLLNKIGKHLDGSVRIIWN